MLITASVITLGIGSAGKAPAADDPRDVAGTARPSKVVSDLSNDEIRQAQQELRAEGLYKGPIDGSINEKTREAINKYQEQSGLSVTGSLDQGTMRGLREDAGTAGSSTPPGGADRHTGLMTNPHPELLGGSRPGGPTAPY
jgi:peptidoglycan hydrolase-like protein with peptidoglycan-binding domain